MKIFKLLIKNYQRIKSRLQPWKRAINEVMFE